MEEACYLDAARLVQYDLPPGWQMTLDERMGILGPVPTGEVRYYRRERLPMAATDAGGVDVVRITKVVPVRRFLFSMLNVAAFPVKLRGRLARPHRLGRRNAF